MSKKVFLFLDDDAFHVEKIRNPEIYYPLIGADSVLELMSNYDEVVKFTTVEDAQKYILEQGCPQFISFDNDLMVKLEGFDLASWLVEKDLDEPGFIPNDFQFFVHSQNINAKSRIYSLLNNYLKSREVEVKEKNDDKLLPKYR